MSRQSCRSNDDMGDKEVKTGTVHTSSGIYLTTKEKSQIPEPGDSLNKNNVHSNGVLLPNEVVRIAQHIKERIRVKEKTDDLRLVRRDYFDTRGKW